MSNAGFAKQIEDIAVQLIRRAETVLPSDVARALVEAEKNESSELGKAQLKVIIENFNLSSETVVPMCQDTGIVSFYVRVGSEFGDATFLPETLKRATARATVEVPIRPNAVHPLTRKNSGDNTGVGVPHIHWEIFKGDYLEITVLPKGGGCENQTRMAILKPGEGADGVKNFVVDTVINAGGEYCPPAIIGVGIGGTSDMAAQLAKKAIMRPLGQRHPEPDIASLEDELLKILNSLGIGPMGLGGTYVALSVNIEYAYTHTTGLPVVVNFQCWAARQANARIYKSVGSKFLSTGD